MSQRVDDSYELVFRVSDREDPTAKSEALQKQQQPEVASSAIPRCSTVGVVECASVPSYPVVCFVEMIMTSKMMQNLSLMAGEAVLTEVQQSGVERGANEDSHKLSWEQCARPSESGC